MESNLCSADELKILYYNSNQCSGVFPTSGSATGTRIVSVEKMRATVFAMSQGDQAVKYENHQEPINYGAILGNYKKAQFISILVFRTCDPSQFTCAQGGACVPRWCQVFAYFQCLLLMKSTNTSVTLLSFWFTIFSAIRDTNKLLHLGRGFVTHTPTARMGRTR